MKLFFFSIAATPRVQPVDEYVHLLLFPHAAVEFGVLGATTTKMTQKF